MAEDVREGRAKAAEDLARSALRWMLTTPGTDWDDPTLYAGRAGMLLALNEARAQLDDPGHADALELSLDSLVADIDRLENSSLYFGLTGMAFTLHALGREDLARKALRLVRERSEGSRWSEMFELFSGNAGVGLGALLVGDVELAVEAVTLYLSTATETAHGANWPVRPTPPRSHHIATGPSASSTPWPPSGEPQPGRISSSSRSRAPGTSSAATRPAPTGSWWRTPIRPTGRS